jgi:hypothetical protein
MDDEFEGRRPRPPRPFQLTSAQLALPLDALEATHRLLQAGGRREACVFWYGPRTSDGSGSVAFVGAPKQITARFNYKVTAHALVDLTRRLDDEWRPLAQIHSHPGLGVEHSRYDDTMASSRRALSIVFPLYGRPTGDFHAVAGVHEWQVDYWQLLSAGDAAQRIKLVTAPVAVEDLR